MGYPSPKTPISDEPPNENRLPFLFIAFSSTYRPAGHHHYVVNSDGTIDYSKIDADNFADNDYPRFFDHRDLFFDPGRFMTNSLYPPVRVPSTKMQE